MAENSSIEWTHHTFNPWIGCQVVSPACDNCYAEAQNRFRNWNPQGWGPHAARKRTSASYWRQPLKWNREAEAAGERRRVFCASLADVFDNHRSIDPAWRNDLWKLIAATPHLDWLLLTKRPQNIFKMLPDRWHGGWNNVWLGTTVENQQEANRRIPKLLSVPAKIRFLSCEPVLEPVDLGFVKDRNGWRDVLHGWRNCDAYVGADDSVNWVICGGESGPNARPMHPDWARDLRDQCAAAGVPFLFKQWGEWAPGECATHAQTRTEQTAIFYGESWPNSGWVYRSVTVGESEEMHLDDEPDVWRFGRTRTGRLLDGMLHDAYPAGTPGSARGREATDGRSPQGRGPSRPVARAVRSETAGRQREDEK